jgi:cell division protein FtsL
MTILTKIHQRMHIHRPEEHIVLEQDLKIEFRDVRLEENKLTVLLESLTK